MVTADITGISHLRGARAMVFNATVNNISIIFVAVSFIGRKKRTPGKNHRPVTSH